MRVIQLGNRPLKKVVFNLTQVGVTDEGNHESFVDFVNPVVDDVVVTEPESDGNRHLVVDQAFLKNGIKGLLLVAFSECRLAQEVVKGVRRQLRDDHVRKVLVVKLILEVEHHRHSGALRNSRAHQDALLDAVGQVERSSIQIHLFFLASVCALRSPCAFNRHQLLAQVLLHWKVSHQLNLHLSFDELQQNREGVVLNQKPDVF